MRSEFLSAVALVAFLALPSAAWAQPMPKVPTNTDEVVDFYAVFEILDPLSLTPIDTVVARGPATLRMGALDPAVGQIQTEIISMDLVGTGPNVGTVRVTLNAVQPSVGYLRPLVSGTDFPADSFFDVFLDITVTPNGGSPFTLPFHTTAMGPPFSDLGAMTLQPTATSPMDFGSSMIQPDIFGAIPGCPACPDPNQAILQALDHIQLDVIGIKADTNQILADVTAVKADTKKIPLISDAIGALTGLVNTVKDGVTGLGQTLTGLLAKANAIKTETDKIPSISDAINAVKGAVDSVLTKVTDLGTKIAELPGIKSVVDTIKSVVDGIAGLFKCDPGDADCEADQAKSMRSLYTQLRKLLEALGFSVGDGFAGVDKALDGVTVAQDDLLSVAAILRGDIEKVETKLDGQGQKLGALDNLETKLDGMQGQLGALGDKVDAAKAAADAARASADAAKNAGDAAKKAGDAAKAAADAAKKAGDAAKASADAAKNAAKANTTKINGLGNKVNALKGKVNALGGRVAGLSGAVNRLRGAIFAVGTQLLSFRDFVEKKLEALDLKVDEISTKIDDLLGVGTP